MVCIRGEDHSDFLCIVNISMNEYFVLIKKEVLSKNYMRKKDPKNIHRPVKDINNPCNVHKITSQNKVSELESNKTTNEINFKEADSNRQNSKRESSP